MAADLSGFRPDINPELGGNPNRRAALAALAPQQQGLTLEQLLLGQLGVDTLGSAFAQPEPGLPVADLLSRNIGLAGGHHSAALAQLRQLIAALNAPAGLLARRRGFGPSAPARPTIGSGRPR